MKFSRSDFTLMRWNILAICASLLVSTIALYTSSEYAEKAWKDRQNAQNQLNDARNRLNIAGEDRKNMAMFAQEYDALVSRKIVGDNQRLDWMEGLEKIRRQNLVTDFRYNIAPQKIYAPQPFIDSGNFNVQYSEMRLQFDLLHEGQLLDFFSALRTQINGQYQLEGCSIQRGASANEDDDDVTGTRPRLKAECTGGWITLKNRNSPQ